MPCGWAKGREAVEIRAWKKIKQAGGMSRYPYMGAWLLTDSVTPSLVDPKTAYEKAAGYWRFGKTKTQQSEHYCEKTCLPCMRFFYPDNPTLLDSIKKSRIGD